MGVGNLLQQSLQGMGSGAAAAAGGAVMPDVMSPAEAAQFLKVSEEDVLAALKAGDLKGKKLGKAYRISKESLMEFLNS
jgi:excisionase family DNA binding protein